MAVGKTTGEIIIKAGRKALKDYLGEDHELVKWIESPDPQDSVGNTASSLINQAAKRVGLDLDTRLEHRVGERAKIEELTVGLSDNQIPEDIPEIGMEDLIGRRWISGMADRMAAGDDITHINGMELINPMTGKPDPIRRHGGQDYMFDPQNQAEEKVWAGAKGISGQNQRAANKVYAETGEPAIWIPYRAALSSVDQAVPVLESMLKYGRQVMDKADIAAVDEAIRKYYPDFKGLIQEDLAGDLDRMSGTKRTEMVYELDRDFRDKGLLGKGQARVLQTDPKQFDAQDVGFQSVGEFKPSTETGKKLKVPESGILTYSHSPEGTGKFRMRGTATPFDLAPEAAKARGIDPNNITAADQFTLQRSSLAGLEGKPSLKQGIITEELVESLDKQGKLKGHSYNPKMDYKHMRDLAFAYNEILRRMKNLVPNMSDKQREEISKHLAEVKVFGSKIDVDKLKKAGVKGTMMTAVFGMVALNSEDTRASVFQSSIKTALKSLPKKTTPEEYMKLLKKQKGVSQNMLEKLDTSVLGDDVVKRADMEKLVDDQLPKIVMAEKRSGQIDPEWKTKAAINDLMDSDKSVNDVLNYFIEEDRKLVEDAVKTDIEELYDVAENTLRNEIFEYKAVLGMKDYFDSPVQKEASELGLKNAEKELEELRSLGRHKWVKEVMSRRIQQMPSSTKMFIKSHLNDYIDEKALQNYADNEMRPEALSQARSKAEQQAREDRMRYEDYKLKGGENYREIYFNIDNPQKGEVVAFPNDSMRRRSFDNREEAEEYFRQEWEKAHSGFKPDQEDYDYYIKSDTGEGIQHGHMEDQLNNAGWIRATDRTGANGERLLHIEEMQSDADRHPELRKLLPKNWRREFLNAALKKAQDEGYDGVTFAKDAQQVADTEQWGYIGKKKGIGFVNKSTGERIEDSFITDLYKIPPALMDDDKYVSKFMGIDLPYVQEQTSRTIDKIKSDIKNSEDLIESYKNEREASGNKKNRRVSILKQEKVLDSLNENLDKWLGFKNKIDSGDIDVVPYEEFDTSALSQGQQRVIDQYVKEMPQAIKEITGRDPDVIKTKGNGEFVVFEADNPRDFKLFNSEEEANAYADEMIEKNPDGLYRIQESPSASESYELNYIPLTESKTVTDPVTGATKVEKTKRKFLDPKYASVVPAVGALGLGLAAAAYSPQTMAAGAALTLAKNLKKIAKKIGLNPDEIKVDESGFIEYPEEWIDPLSQAGAGDLRYQIGRNNDAVRGTVLSDDVVSEPDIAYHYGNLGYGKDTTLGNMSGGRGTGHFGTGTYLLGKPLDENYQGRDLLKTNLSSFNLFKPRDAEKGYALHKALREINDLVGSVGYGELTEQQLRDVLNDPYSVYEKYRPDLDKMIAKKHELRKQWYDDVIDNDTYWEMDDALKGGYDEQMKKAEKLSSFAISLNRNIYDGISLQTGKSEKEIKDFIFNAVVETAPIKKQVGVAGNDYIDTAATKVMKSLGYDGIDVRGIPELDNTSYGSVVYKDKLEAYGAGAIPALYFGTQEAGELTSPEEQQINEKEGWLTLTSQGQGQYAEGGYKTKEFLDYGEQQARPQQSQKGLYEETMDYWLENNPSLTAFTVGMGKGFNDVLELGEKSLAFMSGDEERLAQIREREAEEEQMFNLLAGEDQYGNELPLDEQGNPIFLNEKGEVIQPDYTMSGDYEVSPLAATGGEGVGQLLGTLPAFFGGEALAGLGLARMGVTGLHGSLAGYAPKIMDWGKDIGGFAAQGAAWGAADDEDPLSGAAEEVAVGSALKYTLPKVARPIKSTWDKYSRQLTTGLGASGLGFGFMTSDQER